MLVGFLMSSSATRLSHGRVPRLKSDNFTCCHTEIQRVDHGFCLNRSYYIDTDPTSCGSWEQAPGGGIDSRQTDQKSLALLINLSSPSLEREKETGVVREFIGHPGPKFAGNDIPVDQVLILVSFARPASPSFQHL